jgi:hypothetical protein
MRGVLLQVLEAVVFAICLNLWSLSFDKHDLHIIARQATRTRLFRFTIRVWVRPKPHSAPQVRASAFCGCVDLLFLRLLFQRFDFGFQIHFLPCKYLPFF